jgi:hypothetical protein
MNDATKRPMTKATDDGIVSLVPADRMAPKFRRRIANQRLKTDGDGCCPCGGKLETARDAAMAVIAQHSHKGASILLLCKACAGMPRAKLIGRLGLTNVQKFTRRDHQYWSHAVMFECALAQACGLAPDEWIDQWGGEPPPSEKLDGFTFVPKEQMSLDFRLRAAGVRKEDGVCYACGGPVVGIAQLGMIVMKDDPDGGATGAIACIPCAQLPRQILIDAWPRRNHVKIGLMTKEQADAWAEANAEAVAKGEVGRVN